MVDDYRITRSETLVNTPIFKLRKDFATHPGDRSDGTFYVIDAPDWTNIIALTEDDALLLIRQWRHGTRSVELEIPGGMVDPGESIEAGAARELLEETGYAPQAIRELGVVQPNPAFMSNRCHTFLATGCRRVAEPTPGPHEEFELVLLSRTEVREAVRSGRIQHALVLCGLLWWWMDEASL